MFFKRQKIEGIFNVAMQEVAPGEIGLSDGRRPWSSTRSFVPPFVGAEVVKAWGFENPKGFIEGPRPLRAGVVQTGLGEDPFDARLGAASGRCSQISSGGGCGRRPTHGVVAAYLSVVM